jgi:hypothetical protein
MNDDTDTTRETDEEILTFSVSDDALEATAGSPSLLTQSVKICTGILHHETL